MAAEQAEPVAQLEYVAANVTVRSPRALLLVPCDNRWGARVRVAMECFSQTWGGSGHALLPVVDGQVPKLFRPLVRAFDPDWLCVWQRSIRDETEADPAARHEWLSATAKRMGVPVDEARALLDRDGVLDEPFEWAEGQAAADVVARWCAPHRQHGSSHVHPFAPSARTAKPLCDLEDLARSDIGDRMTVRLDCDAWAQEDLRLGVDARFGRLSSAATKRLAASGLQSYVLPAEPVDLKALAESIVIGRHLPGWSLHARWQAHHGLAATGEPPTAFSGDQLADLCPMALATTGLVSASNGGLAPSAIVVGDDPQAFFVALLLDRLLQSATWLKASSLDTDYGQAVISAAERGLRRGSRLPTINRLFIIDDFDADAAKQLASLVDTQNEHRRVPEPQVKSLAQLSFHATRFLVDPDLDRRIAVPVEKDADHGLDTAAPIDTPQPTMVRGASAESLVWQVDVRIAGHDTASRSLLSTDDLAIARGEVSDLKVRPSRYGLSYESHDMGLVLAGWGLHQMLARPRLRIPPVSDVFRRLHAQAGVTLDRSDAGDLTAGALVMWRDLPSAAADLRGPVRRLLYGFRSDQARVVHGQGYLHYELCQELVEDDDVVRKAVDRFCEAGVLHRGFLLGCSRCGWHAFYRLGSVTSRSFDCVRCASPTALRQESWTGGHEPWWYYDLDQVVRALLEKNNDVVLLALDALRTMSRRSFGWMHETALYWADTSKLFAEIDVLALLDGQVVVGEAKKADHLSRQRTAKAEAAEVAGYVTAAKRIDADVLVFATAADKWSTSTMAAIESAAGSGFEVLSLTRVADEVEHNRIGS